MDWNDPGAISRLVARLVGLGRETEWLECKVNNGDPGEIGEYISALANTALLVGQEAGFMLWGVDDNQHLLGTAFDPWSAKIGNEDLVPWLARMLDPSIEFSFHRVELEGKSVVLMRVEAAGTQPVAFKKRHFIRVGSYKKPLDDHPDHQRRLWKALDTYAFEDRTAIGGLTVEQAVEFIDYPSFFSLRRTPLPESRSGIVEALQDAGVLTYDVEDEWQITNGGALLYARDLSRFGSLGRKAPRVVQYEGTSRIKTQREQVGQLGYAAGFQRLVAYVLDALPR
ncbi:MAG: helix-turn-helix domain-containing protein, partial [Demequina sp.]